jgi:hypothetical protein
MLYPAWHPKRWKQEARTWKQVKVALVCLLSLFAATVAHAERPSLKRFTSADGMVYVMTGVSPRGEDGVTAVVFGPNDADEVSLYVLGCNGSYRSAYAHESSEVPWGVLLEALFRRAVATESVEISPGSLVEAFQAYACSAQAQTDVRQSWKQEQERQQQQQRKVMAAHEQSTQECMKEIGITSWKYPVSQQAIQAFQACYQRQMNEHTSGPSPHESTEIQRSQDEISRTNEQVLKKAEEIRQATTECMQSGLRSPQQKLDCLTQRYEQIEREWAQRNTEALQNQQQQPSSPEQIYKEACTKEAGTDQRSPIYLKCLEQKRNEQNEQNEAIERRLHKQNNCKGDECVGRSVGPADPLGSYNNPIEDKLGGDLLVPVHRGMYCAAGAWHHGWLRPWERSPVIKPSCGSAVYQMR